MSEAPDTSCHRDRRNKEERHKDQQPEVLPPLNLVTYQYFKCKQEKVDPDRYQHRLKLHTRLTLSPESHTAHGLIN